MGGIHPVGMGTSYCTYGGVYHYDIMKVIGRAGKDESAPTTHSSSS